MTIRNAKLLGRLSNGAEADKGTVVHILDDSIPQKKVPANNAIGYRFLSQAALCGIRPGRRSVGWSGEWSGDGQLLATCPKCLKRAEKAR